MLRTIHHLIERIFKIYIKKNKNSQISNNEYQIKSFNEKIVNNEGLIDKIKLEEGREKIYKIIDCYGPCFLFHRHTHVIEPFSFIQLLK